MNDEESAMVLSKRLRSPVHDRVAVAYLVACAAADCRLGVLRFFLPVDPPILGESGE